MDKIIIVKHKKTRKRCKTCNSSYRQEIEELYLNQGRSANYIAEHLEEKYDFKITPQGLLNHFRLCINEEEMIEQIKKLEKRILEKDIKIEDALYETILLKIEIIRELDMEVLINDKEIGNAKINLIKTLNSELRRLIQLYEELVGEKISV